MFNYTRTNYLAKYKSAVILPNNIKCFGKVKSKSKKHILNTSCFNTGQHL